LCTLFHPLDTPFPEILQIFEATFMAWFSFKKVGELEEEESIGMRKGLPVKIRYTFKRLSREEKDLFEAVLLEEMDIQTWFSVAYCRVAGGEVFLVLQ
jgi:hypothetical protein